MPPFTKVERIVLTIVPMTTGFFSVVSSSTIVAMVFRSKKKLGDPYRRIIFGMSTFDIFVSLAFLLKIFKTTPEQPNAWLALGNQKSCNFLGFLHFAGLNGALVYNLSLNIYYLCLIKYNMRAIYFRNRIEPFLHIVPVLWGFISATILVATGHINPAYAGDCLIAPYPVNCLDKPGVECIRGFHTILFRMVFSTVPRFIILALILITLGMLWWVVRSKEKKMDKYRISMVSIRMQSAAHRRSLSGQSDQRFSLTRRLDSSLKTTLQGLRSTFISSRSSGASSVAAGNNAASASPLPDRRRSMHRGSSRRQSKGRGFLVQARWYVVAFLLTHGFAVAATIMRNSGITPKTWLYVTARFFSPLQGFFNIIVYTRPHVLNERKRRPNASWWQAFKKVVASGGDDDNDRTNRLRGGTGVNSSRVSAKSSSFGGSRLSRLFKRFLQRASSLLRHGSWGSKRASEADEGDQTVSQKSKASSNIGPDACGRGSAPGTTGPKEIERRVSSHRRVSFVDEKNRDLGAEMDGAESTFPIGNNDVSAMMESEMLLLDEAISNNVPATPEFTSENKGEEDIESNDGKKELCYTATAGSRLDTDTCKPCGEHDKKVVNEGFDEREDNPGGAKNIANADNLNCGQD